MGEIRQKSDWADNGTTLTKLRFDEVLHMVCRCLVQHLGCLEIVVLRHQWLNVPQTQTQPLKLLRDLTQRLPPHRIAAGFGQTCTNEWRDAPDPDGVN